MSEITKNIRIDKWLWAVRIYKTRSQSAQACKAGKIIVDDVCVKPSRVVKIDDVIIVKKDHLTRTFKVIGLLKNRVAVKLVPDYTIDLTPKEEYYKNKLINEINYEKRDRGLGRPTKKQKREIEKLKSYK